MVIGLKLLSDGGVDVGVKGGEGAVTAKTDTRLMEVDLTNSR